VRSHHNAFEKMPEGFHSSRKRFQSGLILLGLSLQSDVVYKPEQWGYLVTTVLELRPIGQHEFLRA
jgi:hypothetical protein